MLHDTKIKSNKIKSAEVQINKAKINKLKHTTVRRMKEEGLERTQISCNKTTKEYNKPAQS